MLSTIILSRGRGGGGIPANSVDDAVPLPARANGSRQRERSELSTRRMLEATAELLSERGLEGTTLAEIGKRSGYSHGLVTRRFGNKSNLLIALIERMTEQFGPGRLGATIGSRTGASAVNHILGRIAEEAETGPAQLRGFYALGFEAVKPLPEVQEHLREMNRTFQGQLAALIEAGQREGTVRSDADPLVVSRMIAYSLRGAAYFWMLDPVDHEIRAELERLGALVTDILRP
jgi:AcrR family transcriptional regulator